MNQEEKKKLSERVKKATEENQLNYVVIPSDYMVIFRSMSKNALQEMINYLIDVTFETNENETIDEYINMTTTIQPVAHIMAESIRRKKARMISAQKGEMTKRINAIMGPDNDKQQITIDSSIQVETETESKYPKDLIVKKSGNGLYYKIDRYPNILLDFELITSRTIPVEKVKENGKETMYLSGGFDALQMIQNKALKEGPKNLTLNINNVFDYLR